MANHDLISEIDAFTAKHSMAESTFGREALGDWRLIAELRGSADRRPRRLWPETEEKIRKFMADYVPPAESDGTAPTPDDKAQAA